MPLTLYASTAFLCVMQYFRKKGDFIAIRTLTMQWNGDYNSCKTLMYMSLLLHRNQNEAAPSNTPFNRDAVEGDREEQAPLLPSFWGADRAKVPFEMQ